MNILGMFAREPKPGKTKTRLAATIGNDAAATLYAAFVEDLIERCSKLADHFVLGATPEDAATAEWFRSRLRRDDELWFQPESDLGQRIEAFFRHALNGPAKSSIEFEQNTIQKAVLIGSDSPDLPTSIIEDAFARLDTCDVVISPAMDGGFVLIGMTVQPTDLLTSVRWSSPRTLSDTLQAFEDHDVELLQPWYDIDTEENLGTLEALQRTQDSPAAKCPRTRVVIQEEWDEQH